MSKSYLQSNYVRLGQDGSATLSRVKKSAYTDSVLDHAVQAYRHLLPADLTTSLVEFADQIALHYDPTVSQVAEVIRVLKLYPPVYYTTDPVQDAKAEAAHVSTLLDKLEGKR